MLRVLLINPRFPIPHPPLGLGYLASYLKKYLGTPVQVRIFDDTIEHDIRATTAEFQPQLIGVTMVTPAFDRALALCRYVRQASSAPIVAGGPHITALPESIAGTPIDVAVLGEGELTFLELAQHLLKTGRIAHPHIAGIAYVQDGRIVRTAARPLIDDLDTIPPPDRSLFNMRHYTRPGRLVHGLYAKGTSLMPSRGCPFACCEFCASPLMWGRKVRLFSPGYVADEIESVVHTYRLNAVVFLDDCFTTRLSWLRELCELLEQRGLTRRVRFDCESIAVFMNDARAALLKRMGCVRVEFGFESGSPRILRQLKGPRARVEHNARAVEVCRRHGLAVLGNVVLGHMDETPEDFDQSVRWFLSQPIDFIVAHLYTPSPGTVGWQKCLDRGVLDPNRVDWRTFRQGEQNNCIVNTHTPPDALMRRFNQLGQQLGRRNRTLVLDHNLRWRERLRLYAAAAEIPGRTISFQPGTVWARPSWHATRAWRYLRQRYRRVRRLVGRGLRRCRPPRVIRLPWGARWLAWESDAVGRRMLSADGFEPAEQQFMLRLLRPGMTVLDVGAHHGLYSLLASRRVGPTGRVIAFEPSARERRILHCHLWLNRCRNVRVEPLALGAERGEGQLFICLDYETGCNSLRPPNVDERTRPVTVRVETLDHYLANAPVGRVDFVKLDVEGAELSALQGALKLLDGRERPIIMAELYEIRSQPWGYQCREAYDFLAKRGFRWYSLTSAGGLRACPPQDRFDANLVAVPPERAELIAAMVEPPIPASSEPEPMAKRAEELAAAVLG